MKLKHVLILASCLAILITLSCTNPPIFAAIEQEVKLKSFSVRGPISSLLELNNTVYAATPEAVFSKSKWSNGEWDNIGSPGRLVQNFATDGTHLFAATADGVYYYNGGWSAVPGGGSIVTIGGNNMVFGYDGENVYKITTAGIGNSILSKSGIFVGAGGGYFAFADGVYKDGTPVTAVAGSPSDIKSACGGDGTTVFVLAGSTVYHYGGTSWSSQAVSLSNPLSVSYFKYGTSEGRVLVGSGKGYGEVKLASGIHTLAGAYYIGAGESGSTTPPSVNAQYTSSIGAYSIKPVLAVYRGGDYTVFAGVHAGSIHRNTGLWGFYSNGNVEWNRE